ncbi:hypothetical protein ACLMJK_003018 [Lecanora helva]
MASTTGEADLSASALSRPIDASASTPIARPSSSSEPIPPPLETHRANSFASTAAQLESQLTQNVAESQSDALPQPTVTASLGLSMSDETPQAASVQNTAEWEAARESVLSQMVTSQDLAENATPTVKVARGGVKTGGRRGRGGRRPKVKIEGEDPIGIDLTAEADVQTETPTRGKNRGGRPRGSRAGATANRGGRPRGNKAVVNRGSRARAGRGGMLAAGTKRKRKSGDDDDEGPDDTDVSEEFNLLEHTSSGRRITQAKTFSPVNLDPPTSSATKKISPNNNKPPRPITIPSPTSHKKPKLKRRKPGEAAVCINCGRGHSPTSNQIVFCDGCNTPWHQFCHDRPITPSVIQFEEKEWLCSECATLRTEKSHISGKVPPQDTMTLAEKRTYFHSLEKPELVSLLLHASTLHPDLPVFAPPPPVSIPTIVEPRPLPVPIQSTLDEEEYIEIYIEQEPLPYPKAGNGRVLPPEMDDQDLGLLIDEDVGCYSHSWRGSHGWEGPGGMSWGAAGAGSAGVGGMDAVAGGVAVSVGA